MEAIAEGRDASVYRKLLEGYAAKRTALEGRLARRAAEAAGPQDAPDTEDGRVAEVLRRVDAVLQAEELSDAEKPAVLSTVVGAVVPEGEGYLVELRGGGNGQTLQKTLVFYRPDAPSLRTVSLGYTFEAPDDATGARGVAVRRWREERRKGTMIEASFLRDWRLIAVDGSSLAVGGYLFTNVTA